MFLRPSITLVAVVTFLSPVTAQQAAPRVQWWPKDSVTAPAAAAKVSWLPLLSTSTLTVGRYRLTARSADEQSPHERDEIYHVLAGKAKLQAGEETRAIGAGDTVFIAARVAHRFLDIEQDLDVLVFFSAARAVTGGMAAAPAPTEQTPFPETSQRGNTRIFYWFGPDSAGQVAIDFGRPRWQPAYASFLDQPAGRRWRFGENFWTTLDTNIPLTLGGVDVAVGQYYCMLVNTKESGPQLVLLDPADARKRRLDAFEADKTAGGLSIPLQASKADAPSAELDVELSVDAAAKDTGALSIRFGPHVLRAALRLHPHRD